MQQLINRVNEAKVALNVSQSKLSTMIGYSKNYISESISRNCSPQKQQEIIDLIDRVMAGEVIPSQDDVLDMLSEDVQELTESNERLVRDKIALKKRLAQTGIELEKERNSAIHFKESFIQMQKKASQLNKELMTQKLNTNLYFFLALALGILLGVVWS